MEYLKYIKLPFIIIFCMSVSLSAEENPDSLLADWNNTSLSDTTRLEAISSYINEGFLYTQPDEAFKLAELAYDFALKKGLEQHMANALKLQGNSQYFLGNYQAAIGFFNRALALYNKLELPEQIATSLNGLGVVYANLGDNATAIDYYYRSLDIREKLGNKKKIAASLHWGYLP